MCRHLIICVMLLWGYCVHAQTRIADSLKQFVYTAKNDKDRLKAILDLCEEHSSLNRDTLHYYSQIALELAVKAGDKKSRDLAHLAIANTYFRWGWIDSAMAEIDPLLATNPVTDPASRDLYYKLARQKGLFLGSRSRFTESLGVLYQLVADAEKYHDSIVAGTNMNTIGSVALGREAPGVALEWFVKARNYSTHDDRYKPVLAGIYSNMGSAYSSMGKHDSAIYYGEKGIALFREVQNLSGLAIALQKQSNIYLHAKKLGKAEEKLKELIAVRAQTNDGGMWVDENLTLVDFYIETEQIDKAIRVCLDNLYRGDLLDTRSTPRTMNNFVNMRLSFYEALARCYKIAGNTAAYQQTLETIIAAKDSFYMTNNAEALAEAETRYEVQKKENTIVQQKLDIARNNIRFYLTVAGLLFIAVVSYILFIGYRRREKLKMQLMLVKEKELATKAVALAEENERKRIAADLHDNLGAYAASIASNLEFIQPVDKNSQEAVALQELENNSKAIVSQLDDTIWALNKDALSLTAISDRLKVFAKRLKPSYPNIDIDIEERIMEDVSLPPTQAFHLFQVIQEAVVNALKHSGAKQVKILLESDDSWRISVTDNGQGMKTGKPAKGSGGNGLFNMKNRSEMAGWELKWELAFPGGTRVMIKPAVTPGGLRSAAGETPTTN